MSLKKSIFFRRAFIIASASVLLSNFSKAQSPGGVSTNLSFWLKANTATAGNIVLNGANVSQWKSEVGTHSVSQAIASKQPAFQNTWVNTADFNFNPSVQFTNTASQVLSNTATTPNLLGNTGTIFLLSNTRSGATGGTLLTYYSSTSYRYQIKPDFRIQNGVSSLGYKFELNAVPGAVKNYPQKAAIILTSRGTGATSSGRRNGTDAGAPTGASTTFFPAINAGLYLGANAASEYSNTAVSEVIFFNSVLSAADINKVESYLAMKYGITLNEVPGNTSSDYISSNGTVVWNRAGNAPYNSDITFIARDDASGLLQKQSRSVDSTSIVYLYNGTTGGVFPAMNTDNTSAISSDQSFFGIGDNGQSKSLTQCVLQTHGAMARVWKVQKTGTGTGVITVAVNTADVSPLVTNLLVSTNPSFTTATIYPLSTAAGKLYADVNFTGNEYFTFATDSVKQPLSASIQVCSGATATVQVSNMQMGVSYNWYGAATGGTVVGTGNSFSIPALTSDSTLWLEAVGPTNCAYPVRTQVNITVTPAPAAPTVNGVNICAGASAMLQVVSPQTGTTYNWYDQSTGGTQLGTGTSYTTPVLNANTTYYVEATGAGGGCPSTRTAVTVTITAAPAAPVVNPLTICAGNTAALQVQSPVAGVNYSWYSIATGGTALANANSYTTPVLNTTTTYYVEASATAGGCTSTRTAVTVTVDPLPAAPSATAAAVCPGVPATIQVQSPIAGNTYSWFNVATGGTALATGSSYTTPNISGPITYYVEATGTGGCKSARVPVTVSLLQQLATPVVTVSATTLNSITFSWTAVPGAVAYEVSINGGAYTTPSSGATGLSHIVSGLAQGQTVNISVHAMGVESCELSAAGLASGKTQMGDQEIFVPNVFTPNGDGRNDQLKVYGNTIATMEMRIFNQFGELIFETKDLNTGWNGTYKGKQQPSGVYLYVVKVVHLNGTSISKNGAVNLVR